MNSQTSRGRRAAPLVICSMLAASSVLADTTFTFQNGVNGYAGSKDVSINTQYAQYNGGNGVLWRGDPELGCYTTTGSGAYTVRYLVKFGNLSVPAGSRVVSATLTLGLDFWDSGSGNISGFYLKNSWNPDSNRIGWIHRDDAGDWAAPGASSAGIDTVAGKSFQVPPLRPVGVQSVTVPLDLAVVQSWVDSPAANQGIMLVNNIPGNIVRPVSTAGTRNVRPKLAIVIAGGSTVQVTVSPANVTLQPGANQTFMATITGSSNTTVTWSATGGAITAAGVYTAGSTPGNFNVTATSAVDSTRSATAAVVIPGPVQVSVAPTNVTLQPGGQQWFTATVTGTSNSAVTWSATGGTINSSGLYTAGNSAGNFTVTATSAADSARKATATVIIATPVQVSVTPASVSLQPGQTQQFNAAVTGTANTAVTWTATGGTISASGLYTAGQSAGSFAVTATLVADTSRSASASVSIASVQSLPPVPRQFDGAYVVVQSPASGMHFTAPATIRIYADPFDIDAPDPDALTVTFLLNGRSIGTYTGSSAQNGYFPLTAANVAAGTYAITAQIATSGHGTVTSPPVTVFVDNPPISTGPVFNLSSDVVLSGTQTVSYVGTANNRCAINGNGFQIRSAAGFAGSLIVSYCDIRGLGSASAAAIDVTANGSGSVQLVGNVFDTFGTVSVAANDQAQAVIRGNEFRENTLVPVGSQPEDASTSTVAVFRATGNSAAQKFFQGNNVGLSTVVFENTRNWLIGGNTDADSNVLMGVRCGFRISGSTGMVLRGNYSQHNYPHRFSEGENFQLDGDGFLAEHNVIRSSSWPVRGMGGELRYNLIDAAGNSDQVVQGPMSNANIHHNVFIFTVSQTYYGPGAGLHLLYNVDGIQFHNNVMDGGGAFMSFYGPPIAVTQGSFIGSLRNNVFYNFAGLNGGPVLAGEYNESTNPPLPRLRYSDYNDFYNPGAPSQTNYGLSVLGVSPGAAGYGMHDLGGFNGHANPKFTRPTAIPFPFRPEDIWSRAKKVSDVLATYRSMYAPAAGSPLIGAGDPQDGAGGNIGAVGNGEPADQFGKFGTGSVTPPSVAVSVSPASTTVAPGGTAQFTATVANAANTAVTWTATGGTISTAGLFTAGATVGSFTVTATSVQDTGKSGSSAVTIALPAVVVTISPLNVSVLTGGTQQFTATVTNASNAGVTWTATGGVINASGLYTAGSTPGAYTVAAASVQDPTRSASTGVTIITQTSSDRPRLILDAGTVATLRSRAQANTPEWTALKRLCDSMVGGSVNFPDGPGYTDNPNDIGEGYQGSGYFDALMPLGVCYQTAKSFDPAAASKYGAKGVAILAAMSDPAHQVVDGTPIVDRDDGYGIRFYGVTMGIGYDWFHDLLGPALQTQLQNALAAWIHAFENDSQIAFEYEHVLGNYYAGYYSAKCMAALAVQGDNPLGDTWWTDWYNHQHLQRVVPYYALNMAGGGWPEGFANYGPLSTRNMSLPMLAVRTAKGLDLIHAAQPFPFPLDQGRWIMNFTWPSRDMIDDRDGAHSNSSDTIWPGAGEPNTYSFLAGYLALWNDPLAPAMHRYARDAKAALAREGLGPDEWIEFLFWDNSAPEADYASDATSYATTGIAEVAARSDWSNTAAWMSFRTGPYVNNPGAGHQGFDAGSLALVRGKSPLLVNAGTWIMHNPNGDPGENAQYDDSFGNWDIDHTLGNRRLFNTFQVRHVDAAGGILDEFGQWALTRADGVRTSLAGYEDGGSYVLALGQYIEDMYRPFQKICGADPVTSWARQVLYLRPSQFVVYDRTGICNASLDQYLAFHFPGPPAEVTAAPGLHRLDVTAGGSFAGSMTTILPASAQLTTTDQIASDPAVWNKVWRSEIRPSGPAAASRLWLTVFDLAASSTQVAIATPLTMIGGAVTGVVLQSAAGNSAAVFGTGAAGTPVSGTIAYAVPAAQTRHVVTDLTPQAAYTVSVSVTGGTHTVTVTPGGNLHASAGGVLTFALTPAGVLQP